MFFILLFSCKPKYQIKNTENTQTLPQTVAFTEPENTTISTVDEDGNGTPEIWTYKNPDSEQVSIRALDLNQDGVQDMRTYFDQNGNITKEEFDGDFDGTVDIIDYYTNNERVESHIDTNTDKTFDVFRFYKDSVLKREELDINYDNSIDIRYNYNNDGTRSKE